MAEQHSRVGGEQDLLAVAVCIEEKGHLIHLPLTKTIHPVARKHKGLFWTEKTAGERMPSGSKKGGGYSSFSNSFSVVSNSSTVSATACGEAMSTPAIRSSSIGWSLDPARKNFL